MVYDVVIIGAGPGGYLAAIRIAQYGKKVLVIERDEVGGECLNYACIPSKTLLYHASLYTKTMGLIKKRVFTGMVEIDWQRLQKTRERVVKTLTMGVRHLFEAIGVELLKAEAREIGRDYVTVDIGGDTRKIKFRNLILAMGSSPIPLPNIEFDHVKILNSRDALRLMEKPESLLVVGGGAIGLEIGSLYNMAGTKVTIVELLDRILPFTDREISERLEREMSKKGVRILTSSKVVNVVRDGDWLEVEIEREEGVERIRVEKMVVAIGRKPNTTGLGLEEIGVDMDRKGFIKVDNRQETTVENIYAIGDVTGPPMLAHKAYWEALNVSESLFGDGPLPKPSHYPYVIFSKPEVFSIGVREDEVDGERVVVGRFPFSALGRAVTEGSRTGFIKVIINSETKEVLGIHIVGENASIYSSAASLIVERRLGALEIDHTVFPHPTYGEGLWEAVRDAFNRSLHKGSQ